MLLSRVFGLHHLSRRSFSISRCACKSETINVPCRGNVSIKLTVNHPPSTSSASSISSAKAETAPELLLYLHNEVEKDGCHDPEALAAAANLPVITLDFRLSKQNRFPTPLHDVLTGYDWIVKSFFPTPTSIIGEPISYSRTRAVNRQEVVGPKQHRIALIGNGISGTLALSLGLTECRTGPSIEYPARIIGVATNDAICDWVSLSLPLTTLVIPEHKPSFLSNAMNSVPNAAHEAELARLLNIRDIWFAEEKRADAFDPFASPVHFFRTPSADIEFFRKRRIEGERPSRINVVSEIEDLDGVWAGSEFADDVERSSDSTRQVTSQVVVDAPKKLRVYHRRHPPATMSATKFPSLLLTCSEDGILARQNDELARLARRAIIKELMAGAGDQLVEEVLGGEVESDRDGVLDAHRGKAEEAVRFDVHGENREERIIDWIHSL